MFAQLPAALQGNMQLAIRKSIVDANLKGSSRQTWIETARPLTSIGFTLSGGIVASKTAFASALVLTPFNLPIGSDLKSILASDVDCNSWVATTFKFGSLELCPNGQTSLACFSPKLGRSDRLAPWIHAKTVNDVPVTCSLLAAGIQSDGSAVADCYFHGFAINVYAEEQVCQITNRLVQTNRSLGNLDSTDMVRHTVLSALGRSLPVQMQPAFQTGQAQGFQMPGGRHF